MRRFLCLVVLAVATPAFAQSPTGKSITTRKADSATDLASAMRTFATQKPALANMHELAAQLGLTADRFRVSRTTIHTAHGIAIQPKVKIDARAFANQLGLANATANSVHRARGVWNIRINTGSEIAWHGMTLQIWVDTDTGSLDGATVQFITLVR